MSYEPFNKETASTKDRVACITDSVRAELHAYKAGIFQGLRCYPNLINSVDDHIHLLFDLARTASLSDVVMTVKKESSKFMKGKGVPFFAWQTGYGAFAVGREQVPVVERYIERQREHHSGIDFKAELRSLLEQHSVAFDERFIWD